jgi:ABC-type Fe3+/spermidine/putrescine transport system ATPase subunit
VSADLAAHRLVVRRGGFRLGPLDLDVAAGEYLVLVGPSGAGKTVLIETLLGWNAPAAGVALLEGTPVAGIAPAARRIAYLPQDLGILPHLSVEANLAWGLACRGEAVDPTLFARVVNVLHLADALRRPDPTTLSRGEQQRVALGRALLTRPRRLFLDEPCAAVDPHRRRELQLLLRALHAEFGTTVVHVTHDREEAFLLGQRLAVLLAGRLHQVATPAELYARPADLAVARFVAPENLWPCEEITRDGESVTVRLTGMTVDLVVDGTDRGERGAPTTQPESGHRAPVFVGIRPEEVMILDPDRPLRPQVARNVVTGRVEELLFLDGRAQVTITTDVGLAAVSRLSVCAAQDLGLAPGQPVRVSLKARSLYLVE